MSSYTDGVVMKQDDDADLFHIYHSFYYHVGHKDSGNWVYIDQGFPTDGNSRPWFLGWVIPKFGRYTKAAVVHDKLYAHPWIYVSEKDESYRVDRKQADKIMREALEVLKCATWRINFVYYGLRVFGWWAWRKHRKRDIGGVITERIEKP